MFIKKAGLTLLLAVVSLNGLYAGTLTNYTVGDVLLCFRVSGDDGLVVDAGPVSTFTNLSANTTIQITNYVGAQLSTLATNGMSWSALTWFDDSVTPTSAQWTLFVSKARSSLNTQSTPWTAQSAANQQYPISDMQLITPGAAYNLHYNALNTKYAIIEPTETLADQQNYPVGESYDFDINQSGYPNFNGDLDGDPENVTPGSFTTAGTVQRSDFYSVPPTDSGHPVKFLGYFQLNTNGYMSYTAYPSVAGQAPTVTTTAATGLANNAATLNGTVNPNGQSSTAYFAYGLTTSYGSTNFISGTLTGSSAQSVSTNLTGLSFGQTYHYRLIASNATGTGAGNDLTFNTAAIPAPQILAFTRPGNNSVISFQTYSTLTYTVYATNMLSSAPISTWPVVGTVAGDGSIHMVTNGTISSAMFYQVGAH